MPKKSQEVKIKESAKTDSLSTQPDGIYQEMVNSANSIIILWDLNGKIKFINKFGAEFFGYSSNELLGKDVSILLPHKDTNGQSLEGLVKGILTHPQNYVTNINENIRKDGSKVYISWSNKAINDENGKLIEILAIGNDITELKNTQDALNKSEAQYRIIIDNSRDGINLLDLKTGRYVFMSPAQIALTGFTLEEINNISAEEAYERVHPEDREISINQHKRAIAGEEKPSTVEYRWKVKSGEYRWFSDSRGLIRDEQGNPVALVGISRDITDSKKAEEAISHQQAEIRTLFENIPAGLVLFDATPPYKVLVHNRYYQELFAEPFRSQGMVGLNVYQYAPEVEASGVVAVFDEVVRTKQPKSFFEFPYNANPSKEFWFNWYMAPTIINDKVVALVSMSLDVTERHVAEQALKESEERFRALNETSPIGVGLSSTDGLLLYVNPSYESILGYNHGELIGMKASDLYWDPEVRRSWVSTMNVSGSVRGVETRLKRKDGTPVWVSINASPISYGGKPAVMGTIEDVTERRKSEEELRETRDYLDNLFNYANAPIIVWNPEFEITRFNHAFERLTGRAANEVLGKKLGILFPDNSREASVQLIHQTSGGDRWEAVEISILHRDGTIHNLLWNSAMIYAPDGKTAIATIAQGHDITQRRQFEERLRQRTAELEASNKELEAFSYSVSHDLRAPIRSITGFSGILLEDYHEKLDEEGNLYLRKIKESAEIMGQLIDDLLKLSRVSRGEITYEEVNLSDMAQKIVDDLQINEPKRKVKLVIAPDLIVRGDRGLLNRLLDNLLQNAWKFSNKATESQIEVGTVEHNGKQAYFVRDNGVGFDMDYKDKLFSPFQRLHSTSEFPGTGIGLAIVQRIIRRHGGEVWAESKVGEGAAFYFTLSQE